MGKPRSIASFTRQLDALCTEERGNVLQKMGLARRERFRFTDPLVKPYVVIRGLADGMLDEATAYPDQSRRSGSPSRTKRSRRRRDFL
jgi:hypothetical protein